MINMNIHHVQLKGGHTRFRATALFMISNYSFNELFINEYASIKFTLRRRFDVEQAFMATDEAISMASTERDLDDPRLPVINTVKLIYNHRDLVNGRGRKLG